MGSSSTLTVLALAGIALFALAVILTAVFGVIEARRWLRAFSGVRHVSLGPRFNVNARSGLQVIDEERELRPFLRQLLAEGRRDEAVRLYAAFTGFDATAADASLDTFARDEE